MLPGGFAAQAAQRGCSVDEVDILQAGRDHDLRRRPVAAALLSACEEMVYAYGHFGIPCTTFTPLLALQRRVLRTREAPWGRGGLTGRDAQQVGEANQLIRLSVRAMRHIVDGGGEVTFENVADRGDEAGVPQAYWPQRASMCPLSRVPDVAAFIAYAGIVQFHVPMAAMQREGSAEAEGAPVKWVTLFASPGAAALLSPLSDMRVPASGAARVSAIGRNALGESRAALSAAYPERFNTWLALVAEMFAGDGRRDVPDAPPGAQIGCGPALHPVMRVAVAEARARPPSFADYRRLIPAAAGERHLLPIPAPHDVAAECDPEGQPDTSWAVLEDGPDDERPESFAPGFLRPLRAHHRIPGLPPGLVTYESIWRRVPEAGGARVGYERVLAWTRAAFLAAPLMAAGSPHVSPGSVTVEAELKELWARLILLDCRQPNDVVRMRRSTRDTVFPGARQMDRAAFRGLATEMDWRKVDADIVDQAGEGGIESRSHCPRFTRLDWHHRGVREEFAAANRIALVEHADGWLLGPYPLPPCEPCRCVPNNVLSQNKPYVDADGELREKLKSRVTTNESSGGVASPNAGVVHAERTTNLPSHQSHAQGTAAVDGCFRPAGYRAGQYCTDLTGAFSFLQEQRADWWLSVRFWVLWVLRGGGCGFFFSPRTLFGGGWGPNRFMRVQRPKRARLRARQEAFDAAHPYPAAVQAVLAERAALQQAGGLPGGRAQLVPACVQEFIDDESGAAGSDPVPMPSELSHIDVAEIRRLTEASGARAAAADSRCMVHCCLSIDESQRLSFEHALDKVQCGDGIVVLGLRADVLADRSDCPPAKAAVIVAELQHMRAQVLGGSPLEREMIERNTGRLTNVSQVDPGLILHLHAGYALSAAMTRGAVGQPRRRLRHVPVSQHSPIGAEFLGLADAAVASLTRNAGVPLAHAPLFPPVDGAGVLTVVTDASGDDGAGGYAFLAPHERRVWVVSGGWPPDIRAALAYSATRVAVRAALGAAPAFSMPAAETFTTWAVAETLRLEGLVFHSVVAIGDCKPASAAVTSAKSKSAVMQPITAATRGTAQAWLGVQVLRQWNSDADLLSHPASAHLVAAAARSAGLAVAELPFHLDCWRLLRDAIARAHAAALQRERGHGGS